MPSCFAAAPFPLAASRPSFRATAPGFRQAPTGGASASRGPAPGVATDNANLALAAIVCGAKLAVFRPHRKAASHAAENTRMYQVRQGPIEMAEDLEQQATTLRKSIESLEAEQKAHKNKRNFQLYDPENRGRLDVALLQAGLKANESSQIDEETAARILKLFDSNKNGTLEFEEFDIENLRKAVHDEERAQREAEKLRLEKLEAERKEAERLKAQEPRPIPGRNRDTSLTTRVLSVLPYALPLADAIPHGIVIAMAMPALAPLFGPFLMIYKLLNGVPFLGLFLFLGLQYLSNRQELPAQLRFNLAQAIQLDLLMVWANLARSIFKDWVFENADTLGFALFLPGAMMFLVLAATVVYCTYSNLHGVAPREIPLFSERAISSLVDTGSNVEEVEEEPSKREPSKDEASGK